MEDGNNEPRGKFGNHVDEALYEMSLEGWGNESSGDVEAPTGWFARISITAEELDEVVQAFEERLAEIGLDGNSSLIGHWLLREDDQGFVEAEEFDSEGELQSAYAELDQAYGLWASQNEEPERTMTDAQATALRSLCERYRVEFKPEEFFPRFDLPEGWLAGWVSNIYVGVSPEGDINS